MQESLSSPIYNMAVQKANCCGQPLIAIILWFTTVLVNFSIAMIHFWRNILEIFRFSDSLWYCKLAMHFNQHKSLFHFLHTLHTLQNLTEAKLYSKGYRYLCCCGCGYGCCCIYCWGWWMWLCFICGCWCCCRCLLMFLRRKVCKILLKQHGPNDIERCHAILFARYGGIMWNVWLTILVKHFEHLFETNTESV